MLNLCKANECLNSLTAAIYLNCSHLLKERENEMFICEDCHTERQNRKALESQPIQWTGYKYNGNINCPDCSTYQKKTTCYQYLNAYELVMELAELQEKLDKLKDLPQFPVSNFSSCQDMFDRSKIFPAILNDTEAMQQVLHYAGELENKLDVD